MKLMKHKMMSGGKGEHGGMMGKGHHGKGGKMGWHGWHGKGKQETCTYFYESAVDFLKSG